MAKQRNIMPLMDRFSGLPDDVICHILSSLSTQRSVQTCILSRRWRFLWALVPVLKFHSRDYRKENDDIPKIINKVMSLHKGQTIHTFRLHLHNSDYSDDELEKWIATLITRNVCNVDICLGTDYLPQLPRCLFTCKTLVDLRLCFCREIPMTGNVHFPALKNLELIRVWFESNESLPHLLSGCPVLEELIIERYNSRNMLDCCCISSPTIQRLVLDSEERIEPYDSFRVKLDTPALRYLKFNDLISEDFSVGVLASLTEADISIVVAYKSRPVIELVGKLDNVKCLTLSTCELEVPDSAFSALTVKYRNLTELELEADMRFIPKFLEIADNLEALEIRMVRDGIQIKYWVEPDEVPACLVSHLRIVRIHFFECTDEQDFDMFRYILANARVLSRMEIYTACDVIDHVEKRQEALERIALYKRGSVECELVLH